MQQRGLFFDPLADGYQPLAYFAGDRRDDLGITETLAGQVHQRAEPVYISLTRMHLGLNRVKTRLGNIALAGGDDPFTMELTDALQVQVGVAHLSLGLREGFPGRFKVRLSLGQGQLRLTLVKADQELTFFDFVS